jgi:hypothetical protein
LGYLVVANGSKANTKTDLKTTRNDERGKVMGIVMGDWKPGAGTPSTLCEINQEERRITMGILVTD